MAFWLWLYRPDYSGDAAKLRLDSERENGFSWFLSEKPTRRHIQAFDIQLSTFDHGLSTVQPSLCPVRQNPAHPSTRFDRCAVRSPIAHKVLNAQEPNLRMPFGGAAISGGCHPERSEGSGTEAFTKIHFQSEILRRLRLL